MSGDILPPREALVNDDLGITQPWYRYLVSRKRIQDGTTGAAVVTFGDASSVFPASRRLVAAAGELTETDGGEGAALTLGLPDTIAAGSVGDASHLVVLAFDAKGRLTSASQVALNSDNVTEGVSHLFFTQDRARASISGASGVSYNAGTGAITLDQSFTRGLLSGTSPISYNSGTGAISLAAVGGVAGTHASPTSITVDGFGRITAIS